MKKRIALSTGAVLCVATAVIFYFPASRYGTFGLLRGERFEDWRPTSYWSQVLRDENENNRKEASRRLVEIAPDAEDAIPALSDALKDADSEVRVNAGLALMKMARKSRLPIAALCAALKDELPHVRIYAAMALRLQAEHFDTQSTGDSSTDEVPALIAAIEDETNTRKPRFFYVSVRHQAARTLGLLGPEARAAIPALIEARKDTQDPEFVEEAGKALKRIDQKAAADAGVK
jgi:HEAT repeat protein